MGRRRCGARRVRVRGGGCYPGSASATGASDDPRLCKNHCCEGIQTTKLAHFKSKETGGFSSDSLSSKTRTTKIVYLNCAATLFYL